MAEWNKGKVLPQNLHNNQEFKNGDNLAINELNAIVNNSFYASEKAENAERLVEEALSGNIDLSNYYTKDETYSKEEVDNLIDNIEVSGGSSIVIDSELNTESENPVQNKVITQALENRYTKDETYSQQQVDDLISGIETGGGSSTDLTGVERVELIYDKDSKPIINGIAYTSGLLNNAIINNLDLSKYKTLRAYFTLYGADSAILEIDLSHYLNIICRNRYDFIESGGSRHVYACNVLIETDGKIKITFEASAGSDYISSDWHIYRFEGVY